MGCSVKLQFLFLLILIVNCLGEIQKNIESVDYVTYKKYNWKNKKDLSFDYSLRIKDNTLFVHVNVNDLNVYLKSNDSIVSDHVELWLFDPRISSTVQSDKRYLERFILSRRSKFPAPETATTDKEKRILQSDWETNQEIINLAEDQFDKLDQFNFSNQYVFNTGKILTFPEFKVNENIRYKYTLTDSGYSFECSIPILNSMTFNNDTLLQLGYLISVSDIDHPDAQKQGKIMSSHCAARFNQPATFNRIKCDLILNLPDELSFYHGLNTNGMFKLTSRGYRYFVRNKVPFSGSYAIDRGLILCAYKPIQVKTLYNQSNTQLKYHQFDLILNSDHDICVIHLKEHVKCARVFHMHLYDYQKIDNQYYILISVYGPTKWPQGMGWCGAGDEDVLVYLVLDHEYQHLQTETVYYQSCGYARVINNRKKSENKILFEYHDYREDKDVSVTYNCLKPREGLNVLELKK